MGHIGDASMWDVAQKCLKFLLVTFNLFSQNCPRV